MTLVLTLVSVVVGIVELDADADVACVVIRFPRKPQSENRDCSVVLPSWQCAAVRCCALRIVECECKFLCLDVLKVMKNEQGMRLYNLIDLRLYYGGLTWRVLFQRWLPGVWR